ncbi:MAG: amidohydrolase family protein [Chloroflexi bacterium]|nr:amidohydrolase family protein [Chloroflexota bacterium]
MKIDVHVHYFPMAYIEELQRLAEDTPRDRAWSKIIKDKILATPSMWSIEARLPQMDSAGIDVQVLSISIPHVYFPDVGKSVALAQMTNDDLAAVCARYPTRFAAFATVPLNSPKHAIDEMRRAIGQLGLHGITIGANVRGKPLNSPEFMEFYQEADRLGAAIFIHPMIPAGIEILDEFDLAANTGYLFDTTVAAARLVFSGVFEKNRNIKLILPHLGAVIPYTIGRIDASYRTRPECRLNIDRPPSEYFKRFYYDSVNPHQAALRCALETFGPSQIVLGSDYPFALADVSRILASIRELRLPSSDENGIFGQNILQVLPIRQG